MKNYLFKNGFDFLIENKQLKQMYKDMQQLHKDLEAVLKKKDKLGKKYKFK